MVISRCRFLYLSLLCGETLKYSPRVLFIAKLGHQYSGQYSYASASGLRNSAQFVVDALNSKGIEAKLVQVVDNNDIDREVHKYKPTHVIIEAFWVVPEKFDVLKKLYPKINWIVRCHSDFPFLATEGIAIEWIKGYLARFVAVAFNCPRTTRDIRDLLVDWHSKSLVVYLPNIYPDINVPRKHHVGALRVCSFGAIRPLKNQLIQAVGAIRYADMRGKRMEFYVNSTRCEQNGDSVLRNLQALFVGTRHSLVEVPWINNHERFLALMSEMDYALCVSLSETFCITAADAVVCGVPLVCSEVPWAIGTSIVKTNDSDEIVERMGKLTGIIGKIAQFRNRESLKNYSKKSLVLWIKYL